MKAARLAGPSAPGSKEVPDGAPNALAGLAFVFTGELSAFSRDEAVELAKRFGGCVSFSLPLPLPPHPLHLSRPSSRRTGVPSDVSFTRLFLCHSIYAPLLPTCLLLAPRCPAPPRPVLFRCEHHLPAIATAPHPPNPPAPRPLMTSEPTPSLGATLALGSKL